MIKKIILISIFCLFAFIPHLLSAQEKIEVNFFYKPGCQSCKDEQKFLDKLEEEYSEIKVNRFNIYEKENIELLGVLYRQYNVSPEYWGLTPAIFTAKQAFIGFDEEVGEEIENCISEICAKDLSPSVKSKALSLPFLGKINLNSYSPLVLSMLLGGLDGFNACAMVALGFLLAVLVATGVRKRVLLIGGTFILVSGAVYFVFISAWLNLFLFLGHLKLITILVGVVIIIFAVLMLKDYVYGVICKICNIDPKNESVLTRWQRSLFEKMSKLTRFEMSLPLTLLGIAVVAAGINTVELACSLGFPLAFTKVLTSMNLSVWSYYFYLLVYITFYMLDDFIIFLIAVATLRITGVSDKYLRAIKLVSGVVLLLLGLLMLFRPGILMLG